MDIAGAVGHPLDRYRESRCFHGLVDNFYSLKTKKIPAERLASGDCLGCYKGVSVDQGWGEMRIGNGYKVVQSASEVTLVLDSASVALVQGLTPVALGQDSTIILYKLYLSRPD